MWRTRIWSGIGRGQRAGRPIGPGREFLGGPPLQATSSPGRIKLRAHPRTQSRPRNNSNPFHTSPPNSSNKLRAQMARKNAAAKAEAAARKAIENPEAEVNEDGEVDEPPAKKSKKQQHRKDKRKPHTRAAPNSETKHWGSPCPRRAAQPSSTRPASLVRDTQTRRLTWSFSVRSLGH